MSNTDWGSDCLTWSNISTNTWSTINAWTWSECAIPPTTDCLTWGNINSAWMANDSQEWSECMTPPIPPITGSISLVTLGVDATTLTQPWLIESWNPYRAGEIDNKQKKIIMVMVNIQGQKMNEQKTTVKKPIVIANNIKVITNTPNIGVKVGE